ncbi:hypothetical protein [Trujillonella humicola]|uniref:hypothetical protein n=1 Tax=Trujillonella humicola TaxID=3383699 RepID=UPI003906B098
MTWPVVLLTAAAVLATAGALAPRPDAGTLPEEARARRSILGFGLLAVAVGLAAFGGGLLGAGGSGPEQVRALAGAALVVAVPLAAVALVRWLHEARAARRSRADR